MKFYFFSLTLVLLSIKINAQPEYSTYSLSDYLGIHEEQEQIDLEIINGNIYSLVNDASGMQSIFYYKNDSIYQIEIGANKDVREFSEKQEHIYLGLENYDTDLYEGYYLKEDSLLRLQFDDDNHGFLGYMCENHGVLLKTFQLTEGIERVDRYDFILHHPQTNTYEQLISFKKSLGFYSEPNYGLNLSPPYGVSYGDNMVILSSYRYTPDEIGYGDLYYFNGQNFDHLIHQSKIDWIYNKPHGFSINNDFLYFGFNNKIYRHYKGNSKAIHTVPSLYSFNFKEQYNENLIFEKKEEEKNSIYAFYYTNGSVVKRITESINDNYNFRVSWRTEGTGCMLNKYIFEAHDLYRDSDILCYFNNENMVIIDDTLDYRYDWADYLSSFIGDDIIWSVRDGNHPYEHPRSKLFYYDTKNRHNHILWQGNENEIIDELGVEDNLCWIKIYNCSTRQMKYEIFNFNLKREIQLSIFNNTESFGKSFLSLIDSAYHLNPISLTADGSVSTSFQIVTHLNPYDFSFQIKEGTDSLIYGKFLSIEEIDFQKYQVRFRHPDTLIHDFNNNNKNLHVQIFHKNELIQEFPIEVIGTPILFIPGRGFNHSETFENLKTDLVNTGHFNPSQIFLAAYDESDLKEEKLLNHEILITNLDKIRTQYIDKQISIGEINIIGHSAGGILARLYSESLVYKKRNDLNKIITINSQHKGSQLYSLNKSVNDLFVNYCISDFILDAVPVGKVGMKYLIDNGQLLWENILYNRTKEYAKSGLNGFSYSHGDFDLSIEGEITNQLKNNGYKPNIPCISLGSVIVNGFDENGLYYDLHYLNRDVIYHASEIFNFGITLDTETWFSGFENYLDDLFGESSDLIVPLNSQLTLGGFKTSNLFDHNQTLDDVYTISTISQLLESSSNHPSFTKGFIDNNKELEYESFFLTERVIEFFKEKINSYTSGLSLPEYNLKSTTKFNENDSTVLEFQESPLNDSLKVSFYTNTDIDGVIIMSSDMFFHADTTNYTDFTYTIPSHTLGYTIFTAFLVKDSVIIDHYTNTFTWNTLDEYDTLYFESDNYSLYLNDSLFIKTYGIKDSTAYLLNFHDSLSYYSHNGLLEILPGGIIVGTSTGIDTLKMVFGNDTIQTSIEVKPKSYQVGFEVDFFTEKERYLAGDTIRPYLMTNREITHLEWIITGNESDSSFVNNPTFTFNSPGIYYFTVNAEHHNIIKSVTKSIEIIDCITNTSTIIVDRNYFCEQDSIKLMSPYAEYENYWSNSIEASFIHVNYQGLYWLETVIDSTCTIKSDTIFIEMKNIPNPLIQVSSDTLFVQGDYSFEWYVNSNLIENDESFILMSPNNFYHVIAQNEFGCKFISQNYRTNVTNIQNFSKSDLIEIHPNPFRDEINIHYHDNIMNCNLKLFDIYGNLILEVRNKPNVLKLSHLSPGIYTLTFENNNTRTSKKTIKID